jgi:hypothetical protein
MAADAWVIHDRFKEYEGDGTIDMDDDTFVIRLYTSASNIATTSVGDATTATNEVGSGTGYTPGGQTVALTWSRSGGTVTADTANAVWTASGGSITARYAALVDTSTTPDEVVCHTLLNNDPDDVTASDGNTFTVSINPSGVFTKA